MSKNPQESSRIPKNLCLLIARNLEAFSKNLKESQRISKNLEESQRISKNLKESQRISKNLEEVSDAGNNYNRNEIHSKSN